MDDATWLTTSHLGQMLTLTVVRSDDAEAVLRAFACDDPHTVHVGMPGPLGELDTAVAFADPEVQASDLVDDGRVAVWARARDGWVVVTEPESFRGSDDEVLLQLPTSRCASVTWHVNGGEHFRYVEEGRLVAEVDVLSALTDDDERDALVAAWLADVPADDDPEGMDPQTAALLLLERATGIRVTEQDLLAPQHLLTVEDGPALAGTSVGGSYEIVTFHDEDRQHERSGGTGRRGVGNGLPPRDAEDGVTTAHATAAWEGPPLRWLGGVASVGGLLGRSDSAVVRLLPSFAFPEGVLLGVELHARDDEVVLDALSPAGFSRGRVPGHVCRLGVLLADGGRATSVAGWAEGEPPAPQLRFVGSSGGTRSVTAQFWLWPLPPPGPLTLTVQWPDQGIPLTRTQVDGTLLHDAADRAEPLPW